MPVPTLFGAG